MGKKNGDQNEGSGDGENSEGSSGSSGSEGKTFTQAEVDDLIGRAKGEAKSEEARGRKALLEELGVESVDDVKTVLAAKEAADEAQKSELQKSLDAAEAAKAEAEKATKAANQAALRADLKTALLDSDESSSPIRSERMELALDLGLRYALDHDGEDAATAAALKVRDQSPEWFGASSGGSSSSDKGGGSVTPPPPGRTGGEQNSGGSSDGKTSIATRFEERKKKRRGAGDRINKLTQT